MDADVRSSRSLQMMAWFFTGLFVVGNFSSLVGAWTGPIMGAWLVGTQKPRWGLLWLVAIGFVPTVLFGWRKIPLTGAIPALEYLGWTLLLTVLSVLPFTFHRLISPRLPGLLDTLPLPLATVAIPSLAWALHIDTGARRGLLSFCTAWFAATLVGLWNRESRAASYLLGAGILAVTGFNLLRYFGGITIAEPRSLVAFLAPVCIGLSLLLTAWALLHPLPQRRWATRIETVALLRSPFSGATLNVVNEAGHEALVSTTGECFPVHNGIPTFVKPEDLTGDNGKYNQLYEVIGGFYDDIQRVFCALKGFDRDAHFRSYMSKLEVKPGDSVLETSVGTGLNYKYLPRGVKLAGLDLSQEMLANCQGNLRRWNLEADLYLGNAETLPFADESFDVVFHVGGINFFNDRAKAIAEMIRVAKPGSLLLISDETEKHVKEIYERGPGGHLYRDRKQPVSAPIDLIPAEMQEVHLEQLRFGDTYALTFRKPSAVGPTATDESKTGDLKMPWPIDPALK